MSALDFVDFSPSELESLLVTIDESLKVSKRPQFFLWTQGGLQSFIRHETLVCMWGDIQGSDTRFDVFSRSASAAAAAGELGRFDRGMLTRLVFEWQRRRCEPLMLLRYAGSDLPEELTSALLDCADGHVMVHGAKAITGDNGSFFVFLGVTQPPGPRDAYLLELLLPYLHMAVHRMAQCEDVPGTMEAAEDVLLSGRELEVLRWVRDGKTNQEIALILHISPLTVKNHVQNILRKLNVTNRAQAVAKGMGANMFVISEAQV
ncbi:MAG: helix-turn-helix transcriptional regulator [Rhodocyclaceae bacterium]|nr:MAG: helix-turn-helix transcriptional regulator [Rhodocyclaceae bacterium]